MYPQLTHPRSGEFVGDGCLKERDVYIKKIDFRRDFYWWGAFERQKEFIGENTV